MSEPERQVNRLDFLVYYRKQVGLIMKKLDREIEKAGGKLKVDDKKLLEDCKDLDSDEFLQSYFNTPALINLLKECRGFIASYAEKEEQKEGRIYYSSEKLGERFAMLAASQSYINLYIAPRLGVYDNYPPETWKELRFGKSLGDRWDKFQLSTAFQLKKVIGFLGPYFQSYDAEIPAGKEDGIAESGREGFIT